MQLIVEYITENIFWLFQVSIVSPDKVGDTLDSARSRRRTPPHAITQKLYYLRPFKFGMWVHMGEDSMPIVLWPWPSINRPMKAT